MHKYSGLSSTPQNVAIVGDDVSADLGDGALELGLYRYLGKLKMRGGWFSYCTSSALLRLTLPYIEKVRTGKYKQGDENKLFSSSPNEEKTRVFDSIVEAIDHVLQ
jgi:hypothetical protein